MARCEQPRQKIVSMRLKDEEWDALYQKCLHADKNISDFIREMLFPPPTDFGDTPAADKR